jgi:hypothetical protein
MFLHSAEFKPSHLPIPRISLEKRAISFCALISFVWRGVVERVSLEMYLFLLFIRGEFLPPTNEKETPAMGPRDQSICALIVSAHEQLTPNQERPLMVRAPTWLKKFGLFLMCLFLL